jgi:hypothetical protein
MATEATTYLNPIVPFLQLANEDLSDGEEVELHFDSDADAELTFECCESEAASDIQCLSLKEQITDETYARFENMELLRELFHERCSMLYHDILDCMHDTNSGSEVG